MTAIDVDEEARAKQIQGAMEAEGVSTSTPVQADYFGFEERYRCMLPDGISYIEHKKLNEGDRRQYLDKTNKDVRIEKVTQDMRFSMQPGKDRHALLGSAIVDWNLVRDGQPVPFSKGSPGANLEQWLANADPTIVDMVEKDIRKHNPWLLSDMTSEDIRKQITDLEEMLEVKIKEEEAGNS